MSLDLNTTDTWWYFDKKNNMMLTQTYHGLGENGKHDAIGTAWNAYYTYGEEKFLEGIKSCWKKTYRKGITKLLLGEYYYQGQRYPEPYPGMKPISRDHTMNTIYALVHSGISKEDLWEFVSHLPFVLGESWRMTINLKMWLWMMNLCGKKIGWLYYPYAYLSLSKSKLNNKLIYWITGYKEEEHQDNYKRLDVAVWDTPKIIKFIAYLFYPTYALLHSASQIDSINVDNWWTRKIKKLIIEMAPKYNYVIKLLSDDKTITEQEVMSYKSMTGDRWSDMLNKWISNRYLTIITDQNVLRSNQLDRDYLIKLYQNKLN